MADDRWIVDHGLKKPRRGMMIIAQGATLGTQSGRQHVARGVNPGEMLFYQPAPTGRNNIAQGATLGRIKIRSEP